MRRQFSTCLACGVMLALVHQAGAQDIVNPPVPSIPVAAGYTMPYQRGCSLKRIFRWLTYRPLPVPIACNCPGCQTSQLPPLYLYFVGEFGPRSPELAHMTGGYAAGQVYQGPSFVAHDPMTNALMRATANPLEGTASLNLGDSSIRNAVSGPPPRFTGAAAGVGSERQARRQVTVRDLPARRIVRERVVPVRDVPDGQDMSFHSATASREIPAHEATSPAPAVPNPVVPAGATGN